MSQCNWKINSVHISSDNIYNAKEIPHHFRIFFVLDKNLSIHVSICESRCMTGKKRNWRQFWECAKDINLKFSVENSSFERKD